MSTMDIIRARHSVRSYEARAIEPQTLKQLRSVVETCARESGLDIQLVENNPEVFGLVGRVGVIRGTATSIAFMARGSEDDEAIGYWGQKIVLAAQEMGLNTCWVMMVSRKKTKAVAREGRTLRIAIAVGYGTTQGRPRKTRPLDELCCVESAGGTASGPAPLPDWFATAMEAAQLAPTGVNAQKFRITLRSDGRTVYAEAISGGLARLDLGIVKRNFEEAANETGADWHWE